MAAYAVQVRIERVQPHRPVRRHERPRPAPVVTPAEGTYFEDRGSIDLASRTSTSLLGERWDRIGELWSQLTFYLFDPESWRR
jgi:hypothetical protein